MFGIWGNSLTACSRLVDAIPSVGAGGRLTLAAQLIKICADQGAAPFLSYCLVSEVGVNNRRPFDITLNITTYHNSPLDCDLAQKLHLQAQQHYCLQSDSLYSYREGSQIRRGKLFIWAHHIDLLEIWKGIPIEIHNKKRTKSYFLFVSILEKILEKIQWETEGARWKNAKW